MSDGEHRAMAPAEMAGVLERLASEYRGLYHSLSRSRISRSAHSFAFALRPDLVRDRARALDLASKLEQISVECVIPVDLSRARALNNDLAVAIDLVDHRTEDRALAAALRRACLDARAIADLTARQAVALRPDRRRTSHRRYDDRLVVQLLSWLARLLPPDERFRFVAEEKGNLSGCERWRERVDRLVDLAIEMPCLAWRLRRAGWRERA